VCSALSLHDALPIFQVLLELAIGDGRHLLGGQQVLDAHESQDGQQPVTDVELRLLSHGSTPCMAPAGIIGLAAPDRADSDQSSLTRWCSPQRGSRTWGMPRQLRMRATTKSIRSSTVCGWL